MEDNTQDEQLLAKEADDFLKTLSTIKSTYQDPQSDFEQAEENINTVESKNDFKEIIDELFKNFPENEMESPLDLIKTTDFYGNTRDRMTMVYYYLLRMMEYFSLNGEMLKSNMSNDKEVILLALTLEEKLITSFKDSLLKLITCLLQEDGDLIFKFIDDNKIQMSPSSTLILINISENISQDERKVFMKTLVLIDYLSEENDKNMNLIKLQDLFETIINGMSDKFTDKISTIFSSNIIKERTEILGFVMKLLKKEQTRDDLLTNLRLKISNKEK